jgi:hypothetical protein
VATSPISISGGCKKAPSYLKSSRPELPNVKLESAAALCWHQGERLRASSPTMASKSS